MSESKLGAEENVDPSGGSFLESSAESIPGNLSDIQRRHGVGMMTRMLLSLPVVLEEEEEEVVVVGEFAAYLQHSHAVTQFASSGWMASRLGSV